MSEHENCDCAVCRDGFAETLARIRDKINEDGFSVIVVKDDELDAGYFYTVGRAEQGWPDYVSGVFDEEVVNVILSIMRKDISTTRSKTVEWIPAVTSSCNVPIVIVEMEKEFIDEHCGFIARIADKPVEEVRCRMVIFPDRTGRWPWDVGYDVPNVLELTDDFYRQVAKELES